jgi:SHS2 domain-containing protein
MGDSAFHEIEHTADWALRIRGDDHAALFTAAARGMFSLLTDLTGAPESRQLEIEIESADTESLLIDWLNELLYRSEEEGVVFKRFSIHELDPGSERARLVATAWGGAPARLDKTIKAATFSSLNIEHDAAGYRADIVFDV